MRYQVGSVVPFVGILFLSSHQIQADLGIMRLYLPWEHTLQSMEVRLMRCTEHRRVPGEFSDTVEYDGFVFQPVDDDSERWLNQYPRAAHSQMSSCDDVLHKDLPFDAAPPPGVHTSMLDVQPYLLGLYRGSRQVAETDPHKGAMLQAHYEAVVARLNDLGVKVVIKPSALSLKHYVLLTLEVPEVTTMGAV